VKISSAELTTCGVAEDGRTVRLDLIDANGTAVSLHLPFTQAQAVAMTLPSLLTQALRALTGKPSSRYVFQLDNWAVEQSENSDGLLLTLATEDGFQVSFGVPAEACEGLGRTLACAPAPQADRDSDDDEASTPLSARLN